MSPDLRSTLHDAADTYASGAPDMRAARARGQQLTRRRRAAVTAVTVPAVALAAVAFLTSAGPLNALQNPPPATVPAGSVETTPATASTPTQAAPSEVDETPTTDPRFKDVEDGRHLAYLRTVEDHAILYDQAQWREDCDAELQRLEAAGDPAVGKHNIESACITNENRALRLAQVADDVVVMSAPDGDPPTRESMAWLADFLLSTPDASHWSYWLTIEDGVIQKIEQVNPSGA